MPDALQTFQKLERFVRVGGQLRLKTALRLGAGRDTAAHTPDLPVMRDHRGLPFVPGSSLKGVVRSAVEALARSLEPPNPSRMAACLCTSDDRYWCVPPRRKRVGDTPAETLDEFDRRRQDNTCWACRVFGSPWMAGKVRFQDLFLVDDGIAPDDTTEIRNGVAIDRDTGRAADKKVYAFEAAVPDLSFSLRATIDNPTETELGLALLGFRLLEMQEVRLGGGTSRGLGAVVLENLMVREYRFGDPAAVVAWLFRDVDAGSLLSAEQQRSIITKALEELRGNA